MLQYYLPGGAAGMADSKCQMRNLDSGSTLVMASSGLNMVYEAAGMHARFLFCLESLIIDNDMLGQCLRCVRGIEVNTPRQTFRYA